MHLAFDLIPFDELDRMKEGVLDPLLAEGDLKALYNLGGVNQAAGHRAEAQACFRAVADAPSVIPSLRDLARSRLTAQR